MRLRLNGTLQGSIGLAHSYDENANEGLFSAVARDGRDFRDIERFPELPVAVENIRTQEQMQLREAEGYFFQFSERLPVVTRERDYLTFKDSEEIKFDL